MAKLQSDRYERGYLHKLWMEHYCLGKNHISGTSIPAAKSKNLLMLQGPKNPYRKIFVTRHIIVNIN